MLFLPFSFWRPKYTTYFVHIFISSWCIFFFLPYFRVYYVGYLDCVFRFRHCEFYLPFSVLTTTCRNSVMPMSVQLGCECGRAAI